MSPRRTGVVGTSRKENEHRVPVHPDHLPRIPVGVRESIVLEEGYGLPFGVPDDRVRDLGFGLAPRAALLADSEVVILPKPQPDDLREMAEGATLWGWPHCVQQEAIVQAAVDRRLTLLAFEAMFHWSAAGSVRGIHVFHRNNEMAGYCAILHALERAGRDGYYGPERRAVILSFGSVSRGAAHALRGRGFGRIDAFTLRPPHLVPNRIPGVRHGRMTGAEPGDGGMTAEHANGAVEPLIDVLARADVVVNGTLQNPERPLMFVREGDEERLRPDALVVDVSCDEGMGFPFARPTSFEHPTFDVGRGATYYAVDHTPSYLWDAASWEISSALLPYLGPIVAGGDAVDDDETLARAVELRDGVILNRTILRFQDREEEYPHRKRET